MFLLLRPEFYSFLVAKNVPTFTSGILQFFTVRKCSYFYVRNFTAKCRWKIVPKSTLRGSPGGPWGCLGWSWRLPGHGRDTFWEKNGKLLKSGPLFTNPGGGHGDPVGTQKSTKNAPGPENERSETVHGTIFYRLLPRSPFFSLVSSILARFCSKKGWRKTCMFVEDRALFPNLWPSRNTAHGSKNRCFDFLRVCRFCRKNDEKWVQNFDPRHFPPKPPKSTLRDPVLGPKTDPN